MTTATSTNDYFGTARPAIRTRPPSGVAAPAASPSSPRTPLLGRSISSQFGSPGAYRSEPDDLIVYELGARHLSAGFAGESRPRCVLHFGPHRERRLGDYRTSYPAYRKKRPRKLKEIDWGKDHELYRIDLRTVDLELAEDRLERALRTVHVDHLQLDQKARKAILAVPSLLPTALLEMVLKVLFNHSTRPQSINILTTPILACVGAGLRNALIVDVGWGETVVTAIGEYRETCQRRSVRAGKMLTREMARVLGEEVANQHQASESTAEADVSFEYAEQTIQRMGWCRSRSSTKVEQSGMVKFPGPDSDSSSQQQPLHVSFQRLSKAAETTFFGPSDDSGEDDHNLSLPMLAYRVLLALPIDLRAICVSRIVITGGSSALPGLKQRLLQEIFSLVETRRWNPVHNYGSATRYRDRTLQERSANIKSQSRQEVKIATDQPLSSTQDVAPRSEISERAHDDKDDSITRKAEREANKGKTEIVKEEVRGVETLGAWAGASLVASLRVKGVYDVEREEFLKHGLKDEVAHLW